MIRIRSIRLVNVKNHPDNTIEFTDGINVIVGESGRGKSNIGTCIKWVFSEITSTPDHMVGPVSDRCSAHVHLVDDNGGEWRVEKHSKHGNRKNVFFVDGVMYQPSNNKIPAEVKKLDPFARIEVNGKKFTPQLYEQGAPGWMIDASSVDRLALCVYDTDMSPLEAMRRDLSKAVARDSKELELKQEQLSVLDHKIKELDFVPDWRSKLNIAKMKQKKLRMLESGINSLEEYKSIQQQLDSMPVYPDLSVIQDALEALKAAANEMGIADSLEAISRDMPEVRDISAIESCITLAKRADVMLQYVDLLQDNLNAINSIPTMMPLTTLESANKQLQGALSLMKAADELSSIQTQLLPLKESVPVSVIEESIGKLKHALSSLNQADSLQSLLGEISRAEEVDRINTGNMNDILESLGEVKICPTCGQSVEAW